MTSDEVFDKIVQEAFDKFMQLNPDYATQLGLHEPYDYELPDGSSQRYAQTLQLLEAMCKRLREELKRDELNEQHRIDWEAIDVATAQTRFAFDEQRMHELNPDAFTDLGGVIFLMLTRDYAPLEKRLGAIAARIEKTPKHLEEFRSRFVCSRPVRLWTEIAIETAQAMNGLFQFLQYMAKGKVSETTYQRLAKACENLQPALAQHLEWLNSQLPKAGEEWALGREKFEKLLQLRQLDMTSEEILQLGLKYLRELKEERKRLAQAIGPGKSEEEVMRAIEGKAPKTFEEALDFTRKAMEDARRFTQENNIATVYPEDVLVVEETPAFLAPLIPFAAMSMPARFDKPQIGVYVVTRPKDVSNLGSHLNFASIRNTAVHEAVPGHFLQGTVSNRGSIVQILTQGTETVEGWAHYCEQLMAEKGFLPDLESRFVQVNDMIWRAVRIVVDVKLARGEMSFDEAVDLLVKEIGMSREGATAEVKRYTQTPGYALSYLLGKHLILKLKADLKAKIGDGFDEKDFHDTILANGYLPISMVRKVFEQKLKTRV